jgi:hypothetical protein
MKRLFVLAGILLMLTVAAASAVPASAAAPGPARTVQVTVGQSRVSAAVGDRFTVRSRISNSDAAPSGPLIAHLNVASLTRDVYVDPEDWSSSRSRDLAPLAPGGSTTLSWEIQAVNAGSFDVYVVLLPAGPAPTGASPLVASPPVHVMVAARQTLTAGGSLPVAIVVPVLLGLSGFAARYRLRRAM